MKIPYWTLEVGDNLHAPVVVHPPNAIVNYGNGSLFYHWYHREQILFRAGDSKHGQCVATATIIEMAMQIAEEDCQLIRGA